VTTLAGPLQSAGGAHHVSPAVEAAGALVWPSGEQQSWLYCSWGTGDTSSPVAGRPTAEGTRAPAIYC